MSASSPSIRARKTRPGYAVFAFVLAAVLLFEAIKHVDGLWAVPVVAALPDAPRLAAVGRRRGVQLKQSAVRIYSLFHRYWLGVGLMGLASLGAIPLTFFIGGLAWCVQISAERALGAHRGGRRASRL